MITPVVIAAAPETRSADFFVALGIAVANPAEPPHVQVMHVIAFDHRPNTDDYKTLRQALQERPKEFMLPPDLVDEVMLFVAKGKLHDFYHKMSRDLKPCECGFLH
jgi:hypothetical protein